MAEATDIEIKIVATSTVMEQIIYAQLETDERLALTVGWAQVRRGVAPGPNTATACIEALARITGWRAVIEYADGQPIPEEIAAVTELIGLAAAALVKGVKNNEGQ